MTPRRVRFTPVSSYRRIIARIRKLTGAWQSVHVLMISTLPDSYLLTCQFELPCPPDQCRGFVLASPAPILSCCKRGAVVAIAIAIAIVVCPPDERRVLFALALPLLCPVARSAVPCQGQRVPRRAACVCVRKSSRLIHSGDIKLGRAPLSLNHISITTSHPLHLTATPRTIVHLFYHTSPSNRHH